MDYYRRYIGDYLADTQALSLMEDGAYNRLLDYYYASEKPLPADMAKVYVIARAAKPSEKEAVRAVLAAHFHLGEDGWHNTRADKELGIALPAIAKMREVGRTNGAKGGRPKKTNAGIDEKPELVSEGKPTLVSKKNQPAHLNHPPTASHQPNPCLSDHRFPGGGDSPASPSPPEAVGESTPEPPDVLGRMLSECSRAKVADLDVGRAIVERWHRNGGTPGQVAKACAEARKSRPEPSHLAIGYVSTIIERIMREDAAVRRDAEARIERTQREIAERREYRENASTLPENFPGRAIIRKAGNA